MSVFLSRRHGGTEVKSFVRTRRAGRQRRKKEGNREGRKEERRRRKTYFFPCSFLLLFPQMHPVLRAGDARLPLIYLRASVPP
jgi:hypothetical protein